jgi:NitT/TauT family transport system permease protein
VRNGVTLAITGAIVGEMVMGGSGLGTVLVVQRAAVDTAGMFATIIVLCVVASGAYALIQLWERRSRIIESLN